MRELAVQSANDTNSGDDRAFLDLEFKELSEEINRIAEMTQFNKMDLMTGTIPNGTGSTGLATFQVGANNSQTITMTFLDMTTGTSGTLSSVAWASASGSFNIATLADASTAISTIDDAIVAVDEYRAELGAKVNRLTYAIDNLTNVSQNTAAARSRVLDTDYAQATTELARTQIIQQAATAMLEQANQQPQSVLSLLQ
jgi:flagellin